MFLPAPLDSSEKISATVEDVKSKVSSDPLDTDLLTMPDMMTEDEGKAEASNVNSEPYSQFVNKWFGEWVLCIVIVTVLIGGSCNKTSYGSRRRNSI